jgi:hypothetical protein
MSIDQSLWSGFICPIAMKCPGCSGHDPMLGEKCQTGLRVSANDTLFVANLSELRGLEEVALG